MTDKVVVITGGSRGIGRATALAAAARGYRVVVGYASNKAAADEVVSLIEGKNGKAVAVKCDVAEESDILKLFEAADKFGRLGPSSTMAALSARVVCASTKCQLSASSA